jgi:hypothetical protein
VVPDFLAHQFWPGVELYAQLDKTAVRLSDIDAGVLSAQKKEVLVYVAVDGTSMNIPIQTVDVGRRNAVIAGVFGTGRCDPCFIDWQ